MNENKNSSSRSKVGSTNEVVEIERGGLKSKDTVPHHALVKKSSWTSLATKGRRLNKKRKSLAGSTSAKKENEDYSTPKTSHQNYEKYLEDYTSWCNHYLLRGLHREISPDLRTAVGDGVTLVNLVETLTCKSLHGILRQPTTWSQKLDNIHHCFQFLKSEGVILHGISPEDIIEGRLNGILNFFNRLENHFECVRYPGEKHGDVKKQASNLSADYGRNGRISSGYHSEDDGYNDGRTTPIIDVLPGFFTGSESNSDEEQSMIEPSEIRLHQNIKMEKGFRETPPNHFAPISMNPRNIPRHVPATFKEHRHSRDDNGRLDQIGYMPSHPSTKARSSPTKMAPYSERPSSVENSSHKKTVKKTSRINKDNSSPTILLNPEESTDHHGHINYGMEYTAADFGIDDNTSFDRVSISSTGTPLLPDLSSASSFEDPPLDFSSDASGFTRDNFATSTKLFNDVPSESSSYNNVDIQKQLESLHSMYQKLLVVVDKENQRKSKLNLPKMTSLQVKTRNANKQRTKDMKSVSRRFARVESHVVTLARTIDHLRSEIRSQSDTSRQIDDLRNDVSEFKESIYSKNFQTKNFQRSREHQDRLHRLQKLKKFFGEEPPLVALLLQRLGYDRFLPHFKADEIGILELPYMTEQRLQNLGIPLGPRLRILEEIQKLR